MAEYTKLGYGDCTPHDEPEDTRSACEHCGQRYNRLDWMGGYCSYRCWHLDNLGEVKAQIIKWDNRGMDADQIISLLCRYGWLCGMTDSTVKRWKRAILQKTGVGHDTNA
jgi:hypothetical protein